MHLPGGNGHRPNWSVLIVMCLTDGRRQPSDTDSVTAHKRIFFLTILIQVLHPHTLRILCAKLEYISHFNASGHLNRMPAAFRTNTALRDLGKIMILRLRTVSLHAKPRIMMLLHISAAGKIHSALQGVIIENRKIPLQITRTDKSGMQSGLLCNLCGTYLTL